MSAKTIGGKEPVAIPDSMTYGKQLIESTGANVVGSVVASSSLAANDELVWLIRGLSGTSWLKFNDPTVDSPSDPVAAVGDDWLVMEGDLISVSAKKGQKIAVIQG